MKKFTEQESKTIIFKGYARYPKVSLPRDIEDLSYEKDILKILQNRESSTNWLKKPVSPEELSFFLHNSCGINRINENNWNTSKRSYPSAGALYPIEIYPIILNVKDIESGVYHYNIRGHYLERILGREGADSVVHAFRTKSITAPAFVCLMTAVWQRTEVKYPERTRQFPYLEAGHIGQNMSLVATSLSLQTCVLGGFTRSQVDKILDLDLEMENTIYAFAAGK